MSLTYKAGTSGGTTKNKTAVVTYLKIAGIFEVGEKPVKLPHTCLLSQFNVICTN